MAVEEKVQTNNEEKQEGRESRLVTVPVKVPEESRGVLNAIGGLLAGLGITAKYFFKKPITIKYPFERREPAERWRGPLYLKGMTGVYEPESGKATIPPCTGTCPSNVDVRLQNRLVAEKRYLEAYEAVRDRNILPGVLGRICNHPCESMCRRGAYDEPIGIRNLHRFIQDRYFENPPAQKPFAVTKKERVAVIGSGPAGLAAAYDLAKMGYKVRVFERHPQPGGMLMIGVPKYRLSRESLLAEIGLLEQLGIEIQTGVNVGKDVTLDELASEYDAVIIATGLQKSRSLNIPGIDLPGVTYAIPFLSEINVREAADIGKEIIVVGGGNVAIDVARSAIRVGAEVVKLVCLEKREEMPAFPWEIEEAIEEGVRIYPSWGPKAVVGTDHVEGLEVIACVSVFDEERRFNPRFDEERVRVIKGDTIVFSIGQYGDMSFADNSAVEVDERGRLVLNPETWQTTVPNVFACGEIMTGPSTAISSISTGHEVAAKVDRFLRKKKVNGASVLYRGTYPTPLSPPPDLITEERRRRHEMPKLKPTERRDNFKPVELGYTEQMALEEASRCLQCDSEACVGCEFCARACPDLCIHVEREEPGNGFTVTRWEYDMEKCSFCGLCVEACPTRTLQMSKEFELGREARSYFALGKEAMLRFVEAAAGRLATKRKGTRKGAKRAS